MSQSAWQSTQRGASLALHDLHAAIDAARPDDGLTEIVAAGRPLVGTRLLGVCVPTTGATAAETLIERYARRDDWIVAYEQPTAQPVRVDALWRVVPPADVGNLVVAVDLVVSVRTLAPESRPEVMVRSRMASRDVLRLRAGDPLDFAPVAIGSESAVIEPADGPGCVLIRLPGGELSYAEMIHPVDFQRDELRTCENTAAEGAPEAVELAHRLFPATLEKGVILRGRLRGAFVRRRGDLETAARCYAVFAAAEAPLGT